MGEILANWAFESFGEEKFGEYQSLDGALLDRCGARGEPRVSILVSCFAICQLQQVLPLMQ